VRRHSGSPSGGNLSLGVQTGWDFQRGRLTHGPLLSLLSQSVRVDGYAEDSMQATALEFSAQDRSTLLAGAGWQLSHATSARFQPYARLNYSQSLKTQTHDVSAQLRTMKGLLPYSAPGVDGPRTSGTLLLGARTTLAGLEANIGTSVGVGDGYGPDATLFATVRGAF
jgi:outer membrane lipase/esterase